MMKSYNKRSKFIIWRTWSIRTEYHRKKQIRERYEIRKRRLNKRYRINFERNRQWGRYFRRKYSKIIH